MFGFGTSSFCKKKSYIIVFYLHYIISAFKPLSILNRKEALSNINWFTFHGTSISLTYVLLDIHVP